MPELIEATRHGRSPEDRPRRPAQLLTPRDKIAAKRPYGDGYRAAVPMTIRVFFVLAVLLAISPAHSWLAAATGRSAQAATTRVEDVLRALLQFIELTPDDRVAAGAFLDANHKEDLRAALDGDLSPLLSSPGYLIAANVVTVDEVEVKTDSAIVKLTYGPVPADPRIECGRRLTFVLRRTTTWEVDADKVWAKCAFQGKRADSEEDEELREVFRLAMSQWEVGLDVKLVAGEPLSVAARRVLASAGALNEREVRTNDDIVPLGFIRLDKLTVTGGTAEVTASRGPVPVAVAGDSRCGKISARLRREGQGWAFAEAGETVCVARAVPGFLLRAGVY
jgi:hypothetical protein